MTNWPALAPEPTDQPFVVDPSQFIRSPDHFELAYTQGHAATITVAASDTPGDLKRLAAQIYRCGGSGDEVTIQKAIDSLPDGGGEIMLLVGTYLTDDAITVPDNVVIRGQGPSSIIRKVVNAAGDDGVFENSDVAGGNSSITIRDMSVQVGSGVDGYGIYISNVTVGLLSNLTIDAANGADCREAIRVEDCDRILIENSELVGFGDSIRFGGFGAGKPTVDCEIRNCLIYGAGSDGIDIESDSSRIRVISNRLDASGSQGIDVNGDDCVIANNVVASPGINGIDVDGDNNTISNNRILTATAASDGIEVAGNENVIVGNVITEDGGSFTNGIVINSGATDNLVTGNLTNGASGITDSGTTTALGTNKQV